jgi:hypothetical protein
LRVSEGGKAAAGALAGAVADACAAEPAAEQLELVGLPRQKEADRAELTELARASRRGRPPGAQTVATREVKEFCRRMFGYDPMIEGFRWLQHTPETLATAIGCSRAEAFDRLETIRRDLMRYFYAPMQPVDEQGRPVPFFNVQIGNAPAGGPGAAPPWLYAGGPVIDGEQNQGVSEPAAPVSHGSPSHGEDK